ARNPSLERDHRVRRLYWTMATQIASSPRSASMRLLIEAAMTHSLHRRFSAFGLGSPNRALRLEPLEDRRMPAALVGADLDPTGGQSPANWTQFTSLPISQSNLINETGSPTSIGLSVFALSGPVTTEVVNIDPSSLPQHTPSLAGIDDIFSIPPGGAQGYV